MKRIAIYFLVFLAIGSSRLSFSQNNENKEQPIYFQIFENNNIIKSSYVLKIIPHHVNCTNELQQRKQIGCFGPENFRQPIYMGPIFGYTRNYLTDVIKSSANLSVPNIDLPQSGNGYNIGLSYEEMLGDLYNSTSSLIFNLNCNGMNFSSEKSFINSQYNNKILDLTGKESDSSTVSINYKNEIFISSISFDVLYKLNFIPGVPFGIIIGPSFDFNMKHDLKETVSLDNSDLSFKFKKQDGILLDESGRNGTIFNDKISDFSAFQFILKAGIQYEIILPNRMYITPYIIYGYNVTSLLKNSSIRLSNLNLGMAIHFAI